jgi:hypothetical protein
MAETGIQDPILVVKVLKLAAHGPSLLAQANRLQNVVAIHLSQHVSVCKSLGQFLGVRFDASNVGRQSLIEDCHEFKELGPEVAGERHAFLRLGGSCRNNSNFNFGQNFFQESVAARVQHGHDVIPDFISILIQKAYGLIPEKIKTGFRHKSNEGDLRD